MYSVTVLKVYEHQIVCQNVYTCHTGEDNFITINQSGQTVRLYNSQRFGFQRLETRSNLQEVPIQLSMQSRFPFLENGSCVLWAGHDDGKSLSRCYTMMHQSKLDTVKHARTFKLSLPAKTP